MVINGKRVGLHEGKTILDLLDALELNHSRVVIELNKEIISKESYAAIILKEEDIIEIISFVGGG